MDKIIAYLTIFGICILVIIGGNYFLTDDVGNFSMEKAMNLIPNIEEAIIDKKNEITQTRDINEDMADKKDAERLDIEGPTNKQLSKTSTKSVTKQYMTEMNEFNDSDVTSFQKGILLKEIQDKYLGKRLHWSGNVRNVKEYNDYLLLTMRAENGNMEYKWNTVYCYMVLNDFSRISLKNIKKRDKVTVTGDYRVSDEDPWIDNCEIVANQ